jgi:hypothetical protein
VDSDKIVVKNLFIFFWRSEYLFPDIKKVEIGNTGGLNPNHIQIFTHEKKSIRYAIELVNPKRFTELVKDLEEKGVKVEVNVYGHKYPL